MIFFKPHSTEVERISSLEAKVEWLDRDARDERERNRQQWDEHLKTHLSKATEDSAKRWRLIAIAVTIISALIVLADRFWQSLISFPPY